MKITSGFQTPTVTLLLIQFALRHWDFSVFQNVWICQIVNLVYFLNRERYNMSKSGSDCRYWVWDWSWSWILTWNWRFETVPDTPFCMTLLKKNWFSKMPHYKCDSICSFVIILWKNQSFFTWFKTRFIEIKKATSNFYDKKSWNNILTIDIYFLIKM